MKLNLHFNNSLKNKFPEKQMIIIAQTLIELATNSAVQAELPDIDQYVNNFMAAMEEGDLILLEYSIVNLYTQLHSAGSKYSTSEKELLKKRSGYLSYPGGLSPIIMAKQYIRPESIVADLGAGNGLQGLLLQHIYPHRRTLQVELSAEMIRIGRIFQQALGISTDRIEWIHDDIVNVSIEDADFIYIYRPARPLDSGNELYQAISHKLAAINKPLVIFSVADCLAKFLDKRFSIFYTDGHLTCFVKECR